MSSQNKKNKTKRGWGGDCWEPRKLDAAGVEAERGGAGLGRWGSLGDAPRRGRGWAPGLRGRTPGPGRSRCGRGWAPGLRTWDARLPRSPIGRRVTPPFARGLNMSFFLLALAGAALLLGSLIRIVLDRAAGPAVLGRLSKKKKKWGVGAALSSETGDGRLVSIANVPDARELVTGVGWGGFYVLPQ